MVNRSRTAKNSIANGRAGERAVFKLLAMYGFQLTQYSGSTETEKTDLINDTYAIEVKTRKKVERNTTNQVYVRINKDWIDKVEKQALAMGKKPVLFFRVRGEKKFCVFIETKYFDNFVDVTQVKVTKDKGTRIDITNYYEQIKNGSNVFKIIYDGTRELYGMSVEDFIKYSQMEKVTEYKSLPYPHADRYAIDIFTGIMINPKSCKRYQINSDTKGAFYMVDGIKYYVAELVVMAFEGKPIDRFDEVTWKSSGMTIDDVSYKVKDIVSSDNIYLRKYCLQRKIIKVSHDKPLSAMELYEVMTDATDNCIVLLKYDRKTYNGIMTNSDIKPDVRMKIYGRGSKYDFATLVNYLEFACNNTNTVFEIYADKTKKSIYFMKQSEIKRYI